VSGAVFCNSFASRPNGAHHLAAPTERCQFFEHRAEEVLVATSLSLDDQATALQSPRECL
jgi:hypothetical protein